MRFSTALVPFPSLASRRWPHSGVGREDGVAQHNGGLSCRQTQLAVVERVEFKQLHTPAVPRSFPSSLRLFSTLCASAGLSASVLSSFELRALRARVEAAACMREPDVRLGRFFTLHSAASCVHTAVCCLCVVESVSP